ncbi:tRNA pseudouridine(13) synthase TruD [bacterium]|nr:tRNA pseudouridine(13) synthase TruD [bacterium]
MLSLSEAQLKEREVLKYYKKNNPNVLITPSLSEKEILSRIGINVSLPIRPQGYIRFYPQDFIVEEISKEGEISKIEPKENVFSPSFPFHLSCDLIKVGLSTFDALNSLADNLQIKLGRISYRGLKDVNAITSQKIAFLDLNCEIFEKIKNLSLPYIFLTNFNIQTKPLLRGDLFGNRFTIFIRTNGAVNERWFSQNLEKIEKEGFLNFYHTQRFGTPRFLSHILGKLILQGEYEKAVFEFFTEKGLQEIPLIKQKRQEVKKNFGDWRKAEKIFSELPFTFRNEILLLSYLKENPKDFIGALIFFKDQTKFWVYSYASYLFNQILSLKGLELPAEIPLFLSDKIKDRKIYEFWLEKDGIQDFQNNIRPFRFLRLQRRFVKTKVFPQNVLFKIVPEGVILSFILEKGAYATTFLMNLFEIFQGLPLPDWVNPQEYDIKKLLGIGSIRAVKEIFGEVISSPMVLY